MPLDLRGRSFRQAQSRSSRLCLLGVHASWTGHTALKELGVTYFALYLMHDRNGSRLQGLRPNVLGPCYSAGLASSVDPACPPQNAALTSLSSAFGNSFATSTAASPLVSEAVRVLLPSGELYISAP